MTPRGGSGEPFVHDGGPTQEALFAYVAGRLHPEAAGWIGTHVEACTRCKDAMARIDSVRDALEPPAEPPFSRQANLTAVRKRLEHEPLPWGRMAWGTLVGMAAGIALVVALRAPKPRPQLASLPVPCTIVSRQGVADVSLGSDRHVAQAKLSLPLGGALTVAPDSRALLRWGAARVAVEGGAAGAQVQLLTSNDHKRELKLDRGRVVLDVDPLAVGAELAVVAPDARVTVHGTRFLVEAGAGGTTVACDRGRVRVGRRARTIDVAAGQRLDGALAPTPILPTERARLEALEPAFSEASLETLDVLSDAPGATVDIDGVARGGAPLSIAIAPGIHVVSVRAPGRLPVEERVAVVAGTPTLFHADLPTPPSVDEPEPQAAAPPPRATTRHAKASAKPAGPPAHDVLAQARAEVLAGEYDRAIERLDELQLAHPNTVEAARAALLEAQAERLAHRPERALPLYEMVARGDGPEAEQAEFMLGQTLGRDVRDPARAAAAFAESQRRFPRGIFAEESSFRRGEALLHAGETRAAIDALEHYLESYANAPHADDAHLYLAEAHRDRLNDCAGALPHLRAVADGHGPRAEVALVGVARCLAKIGRDDDARAAWNRYLAAQPHGRYADEAHAAVGSARLEK